MMNQISKKRVKTTGRNIMLKKKIKGRQNVCHQQMALRSCRISHMHFKQQLLILKTSVKWWKGLDKL